MVNVFTGCGSSKKDPLRDAGGIAESGRIDAGGGPTPVCPGDGGFAMAADGGMMRVLRDAGPGQATCDPDVELRLEPLGGRQRYCAVDIGSKNVKLTTAVMIPGDLSSLISERDCKAAKNLGDKTYDQKMELPLALPMKDLEDLVTLVNDYRSICERESGKLVAAIGTEWARRATNKDEIKKALKDAVGVDFEIVTGDREGVLGYTAATRGVFNRIILDTGSRSFQISYWHEKDPAAKVVTAALGSDEASDRFFSNPIYASYGVARAAYVTHLKGLLRDQLDPLKEYLRTAKVDPFLISLGDSGLALAVDGSLIDPCNGRFVEPETYDRKSAERKGAKRGISAEQTRTFLAALSNNNAWFQDLRSDRLKKAYGNKVMAALALISYLFEELGLKDVQFSSAELAEGVIIEKLK